MSKFFTNDEEKILAVFDRNCVLDWALDEVVGSPSPDCSENDSQVSVSGLDIYPDFIS